LQSAGNETPVVALTANVLSHEVETYLEQGFENCLAKPIERAEFIRVISTILRMSAASIPDNLMDDSEFLQLKNRFLARLPTELSEFNDAVIQGELALVKRLCHRIKGAAAIFKELELADACDKLERKLKTQTLDDSATLISKIRDLISVLIASNKSSTKS
jgi:HPt (histidine-containing phosphotransfer) domain-containing protein